MPKHFYSSLVTVPREGLEDEGSSLDGEFGRVIVLVGIILITLRFCDRILSSFVAQGLCIACDTFTDQLKLPNWAGTF